MKTNLPVTNNEVMFEENQMIVSKTDLKGILTYVNPDFIEISGFTEHELIGKNHNMVRHPDMPAEAFQDLWDAVKNERPWVGMVKNRCKNGDYYWVVANVTPLRENGRVTQYMSVRNKPTRAQVEEAEILYKEINSGKATMLEKGWLAGIKKKWKDASIGKRIFGMSAILMGILAVVGAWAYFTISAHIASGIDDIEFIVLEELVILGVILVIGLVAISIMVKSSVIRPIEDAIQQLQALAEGDYKRVIDIKVGNEAGNLLRVIKSTQVKLGFDISDTVQKANESKRIEVGLDNVTGNVMMADNDGIIVYLNRAVVGMMLNAQSDIREQLPNFDANDLLGANIDVFHKKPEHQQAMLKALTGTHNARIKVGRRTFDLIANAVTSAEGRRLGTVVEWMDVTEQLDAENQVESIIEAAVDGILDRRIDTENYEGFMKSIGDGMNRILDTVVKPITEVNEVLAGLAEGDLTGTMDGEYSGEFAKLQSSINDSLSQLQSMVGKIRTASSSISTGATEISQGNANLSQRTEEQASSLEETASSMEEMTSTVKQNADNAHQASQLAVTAREQAEKGGDIVSNAIIAMADINESSKKISEIIGVIDEIAFQTNLLALNAAVEAARAGEQGRGFAVVASEVRNLAQRSASAAKEIKDLIKDSVEKVDHGTKLVDGSGKALEEIVIGVKKVSDIVSEIAAASQEQSTGIEQVNKAIMQMDDVTQQNAALVEQGAAAGQALDEQASGLRELMRFFTVNDSDDDEIEVVKKTAKQSTPAVKKSKKKSKKKGSSVGDDSEWEDF